MVPLAEEAGDTAARERLLEHLSQSQGTKMVLLRLNYAVEMRYGVC